MGLKTEEIRSRQTNTDIERISRVSYEVVTNQRFTPELLKTLGQISADATWQGGSREQREAHDKDILDQFKSRADKFNFVVIVKNGSEIVGYGGYRLLKIRDGQRRIFRSRVMYESAKMVRPDQQGQGFGKKITENALIETKPSYVAVRTQNPNEASSFQSALNGVALFPLDQAYSDNVLMERVFLATADALGAKANVEFETGIDGQAHPTGVLKNMYGHERFGQYSVNSNKIGPATIQKKFDELGVNQDDGDAVLIMGKLN